MEESNRMKTLVAFFSRAGENYFAGHYKVVDVGNTELAVNQIRSLIPADQFKIEMAEPYSADYKTCVAQSVRDFKSGVRPPLKNTLSSIAQYDTVILAYPCYCGTAPMAVFSFLEQFDWTGKTILPLCTNEGSGMGRSEADLCRSCPGAAIAKGLPIIGGAVSGAGEAIKAWLAQNQLMA